MDPHRVLLVDGLNLFLRCFSAIPTMGPNGDHLGGFLGSLRAVKNLVRDTRCDHAIVAWDGKGGSRKRRGIYREYKEGRKPRVNRHMDLDSPEEGRKNLDFQQALLRKYLGLLGVCQVEVEDCEADDVIAALCTHVYDGVQKVIVSTDRDFWQLVGPTTVVYSPTKRVYYSSAEVRGETGVLPCNYIYVKALCGDSSDNVKGIRGLGPKTVAKLFPFLGERESSLEELREAAKTLEPKGRREKELLAALLDQWELVTTNVRLMELSRPIVSPQSVRSVRHQAGREPAPLNASAVRLALVKDGIQLADSDFFMAFQDLARRRSALQEGTPHVR